MPSFPARLHCILARDAATAVIIRRGPAKSVCTIGWDRERDTFQLGQWMHGRIYERRCDLSPDGKYFLYFALNGRWQTETRGSYTAVSRTPYLKAITLFPKGDAWQGGGQFTGQATLWLNGCHQAALGGSSPFELDTKFQPPTGFGAECLSAYYPRLLRDGWSLVERVKNGAHDRMDVFEKPLPGGWTLRKYAYTGLSHKKGSGPYWDEHELLHRERSVAHPFPEWEWADVDGRRLVWAAKGALLAGEPTTDGLAQERVLADFNAWKFSPAEAPY